MGSLLFGDKCFISIWRAYECDVKRLLPYILIGKVRHYQKVFKQKFPTRSAFVFFYVCCMCITAKKDADAVAHNVDVPFKDKSGTQAVGMRSILFRNCNILCSSTLFTDLKFSVAYNCNKMIVFVTILILFVDVFLLLTSASYMMHIFNGNSCTLLHLICTSSSCALDTVFKTKLLPRRNRTGTANDVTTNEATEIQHKNERFAPEVVAINMSSINMKYINPNEASSH